MVIFISLLVIALAVGLIVFFIDWVTHIHMVKGEYRPYDWCTFKTFMKEFDKYKNHRGLYTEKYGDMSIFVEDGWKLIVYLHANIIKFNDKCMILYPHSWLRYRIWKRNFTKVDKPVYRRRGLWK